MHQSTFFSNYNALQTSWTKRAGRFVFDFNFTWQKQLGTAAFQVNPFVTRRNYGVLNVDRPFLFNSNYIYQFGEVIHGGIKTSSCVALQTDGPFPASPRGRQVAVSQQENRFSGNFGLGLNLRYWPLPANASTDGITTNIGSANLTMGKMDAALNILPVLVCNPKSGLKSNQLLIQTCFGGGVGDRPARRPEIPVLG